MTSFVPISAEPIGYAGDPSANPAIYFDALAQTAISQYANSPVLTGIIGALNFALDRQAALDEFYAWTWDVDQAQGFGLDIIGRRVGVSRALYVPDSPFLGFSQSSDAVPFGSGIFYGGGSLTPNYNLTDIAYRRLILAKAALNITDCAIPSINAILMTLFPDYGNSYVRDNGDMTMTYVFGAALSKVDYAIVTQSGALPKPAGVAFDVETP